MKRRVTAMVALAALLMCAFAGAALAESMALETEVAVSFVESIYFAELDTGGMDIAFGTRKLPPTKEDSLIVAEDGGHILRVSDRRREAGNWKVDAVMSAMTSGSESFTCALRLYNPTLSDDDLTANLTGEAPDQYTLINQSSQPIMTAAADLTQNNYDLTVSAENTRLLIPADQSEDLKILNYSATITWTLTVEPLPITPP